MSQPYFPEYASALEPTPHTHTQSETNIVCTARINVEFCASASQILKPPLIRVMGVVLTTMVERELEDYEIGR